MNMKSVTLLILSLCFTVSVNVSSAVESINNNTAPDNTVTAAGFLNPSDQYKTWVYWWWLKGWIDEEGIRADLDHMKNMGISGALVFNAGPAHNQVPFTTEFMSPRWRQLFRYAVEQLRRGNARLLGVVLNNVGLKGSHYYYRRYYHYYSDATYYDDEDRETG